MATIHRAKFQKGESYTESWLALAICRIPFKSLAKHRSGRAHEELAKAGEGETARTILRA